MVCLKTGEPKKLARKMGVNFNRGPIGNHFSRDLRPPLLNGVQLLKIEHRYLRSGAKLDFVHPFKWLPLQQAHWRGSSLETLRDILFPRISFSYVCQPGSSLETWSFFISFSYNAKERKRHPVVVETRAPSPPEAPSSTAAADATAEARRARPLCVSKWAARRRCVFWKSRTPENGWLSSVFFWCHWICVCQKENGVPFARRKEPDPGAMRRPLSLVLPWQRLEQKIRLLKWPLVPQNRPSSLPRDNRAGGQMWDNPHVVADLFSNRSQGVKQGVCTLHMVAV